MLDGNGALRDIRDGLVKDNVHAMAQTHRLPASTLSGTGSGLGMQPATLSSSRAT